MNKKTLLLLALVVILIPAVFAAAGKVKDSRATDPPVENEAKLVEVASVSKGKMERPSKLSAVLKAVDESLVSFEVPGRIVEMRFGEGDRVDAGDVLARVDSTNHSLQLTKARSGLEKAQLAYQQARDHWARVEQLYMADAVSRVDYENAQNRLKMAEEGLAEANQSLVLLEQDKSVLRAPISGTVLAKLSETGQVAAAGAPVYSIGRIDTLKAVLPVPDREIAAWQAGQQVVLRLYGQERRGTVTRVYPSTNRGTGTIGVEVNINNSRHDWYPGQVVLAGRAEAREGIFVPAGAVINRGEAKPYVFLVTDGKAVKRSVTIGDLFGGQMEVTSGLEPGETLVIRGAHRLFEGDGVVLPGGSGK